ncbi:MAG TPA: hypothetical protein VFO19_20425 [Vicinamibacterales bacterium]|nr:hypothetical protein [Vicinamibacterales bacterium]
MRARITVFATAVSLAVPSSPALALSQQSQSQSHIVDAAALRRAIDAQTARDDANRRAVREALQRDDVRETARALGLDVKAAEDALATMSSEDLARVGAPARVVNDRAGAASTVTISITTLLLLLILIVLIVK